jgi:hypothetical protein
MLLLLLLLLLCFRSVCLSWERVFVRPLPFPTPRLCIFAVMSQVHMEFECQGPVT